MSTLLDVIQRIVNETMRTMKTMDGIAGTVMTVNPLSISIRDDMPPLPAASLILSDLVVEKKIDLTHTHTLNEHTHSNGNGGAPTGAPISPNTNTDTGNLPTKPFLSKPTPLYGKETTYQSAGIVTPGLAVGDKVILLRMVGGQQFLVFSRAFPAN